MLIQKLHKKGLIKPPKWLPDNVMYLTIMGSISYGVSNDASDFDIYGFCMPPRDMVFPHLAGHIPGFGKQLKKFEQFQQHHVIDPDENGGKGREYDFSIYSIVKYFQLAMTNNPNMVDSLFTPRRCVLHSTKVGEMVRENRKLFLHKGAWHKFKGYAYSQVNKMKNKNPEGKRKALVDKYGYDCFLESETEFLTNRGWLKYEDIKDNDLIANINKDSGELFFEKPLKRIKKKYSGKIYTVDAYMTRCSVTENHQMLISPARRSPITNYSYDYFPDKADWRLDRISNILKGRRSWFHIRKAVMERKEEYPVSDEYLSLSGLYLSDGTMNFRDNEIKCARLTQTDGGKIKEFSEEIQNLSKIYDIKKYDYDKETVWNVKKKVAEKLYSDFSHRTENKNLPLWTLKLSHRQAGIMWRSLVLGDGTYTTNGDVLYTTSKKLADSVTAMMTSAGYTCSLRGPYKSISNFTGKEIISYQIYLCKNQKKFNCVSFNRIRDYDSSKTNKGANIKIREVEDENVVCFTMPKGTLVTRNSGKVSIQGNCKFAYHVVRLLSEIEMILTEHDLDLERNREQLKSIRRGEWAQNQIEEYFTKKEKELETIYSESKLQHSPDEAKIKTLLLQCLEEHYGSLDKCVVVPDAARTALKEIEAVLEKHKALLQ